MLFYVLLCYYSNHKFYLNRKWLTVMDNLESKEKYEYQTVIYPKVPIEMVLDKQSLFKNKLFTITKEFKIIHELHEMLGALDGYGKLTNSTFVSNSDLISEYPYDIVDLNVLSLMLSKQHDFISDVVMVAYQGNYHVLNNENCNLFPILKMFLSEKEGYPSKPSCSFMNPMQQSDKLTSPRLLNLFKDVQSNPHDGYGFNCTIYQFNDGWTDSEIEEYMILLKNMVVTENYITLSYSFDLNNIKERDDLIQLVNMLCFLNQSNNLDVKALLPKNAIHLNIINSDRWMNDEEFNEKLYKPLGKIKSNSRKWLISMNLSDMENEKIKKLITDGVVALDFLVLDKAE